MKNDRVIRAVIKKFSERSLRGQKKYGTTLDRDDLSLYDWLNHLQEELMDATAYVEKLKRLCKTSSKHNSARYNSHTC